MQQLLLIVLCVAATLQGSRVPLNLPPAGLMPTAEELSETVGSESDAASIISQALAGFVAQAPPSATVTVLASQIPSAWLPSMPNVQFIRLDDEGMQSHYNGCGAFLWVNIDHSCGQLVVRVGEGKKECLKRVQAYRFTWTLKGWQLGRGGTGLIQPFDCECS